MVRNLALWLGSRRTDVINRFPSRYYLTEDGGVLKWNNRLAKTSTACSGLHVQLGLVTETVEKSYRDDAV